ncbi:MAG: DUF3871 family protein [Dolichospermum sp.]|jgi:hypothetical protein|nr:DUF3871 family protein [Dolichospermum sp.]
MENIETLPAKNQLELGQSYEQESTDKPFIQANTISICQKELKDKHIIPVFIKDNEPVISQTDFIEITHSVVSEVYNREQILSPSVRLSHPVMGRIPDAKHKAASQLLEHEKTLYYERMAFVIELPSINSVIDGNTLSLTVGGVKAYNLDNLYNRKGSDEHFKVFIGFKNIVCTNLCVWSDGFRSDLKVKSIGELKASIRHLFESYSAQSQLQQMNQLTQYSITDQQFAQLVGKCRMYQHLPNQIKSNIPQMLLGDNQVGAICKDFYRDESFCRNEDGTISLWKLYNLFTGSNKSTYIDNFLDRSVNAYHFVEQIRFALQRKVYNWYLN